MKSRSLIPLLLLVSASACEGPEANRNPVPAAKPHPVPAVQAEQEARTSDAVVIEQLARSLQTVEDFQQQVEQQINERNLEEELAKLEQELKGEDDQ